MRIILCGEAPRKGVGGWKNPWPILRELQKLPLDVVVVHGDALGADRLGGEIAKGLDLEVVPVPAEWNRYGRGAGPIRNKKMLNMGIDLVLAFHEDISRSRGTKHMVSIAKQAGVVVKVLSS